MNRNNHLNSLDLIAPLNRLNKVFFGIFGTLLFISVVFWVYTNVFVPNQLATIYSNKLPLSNGQSLIIAYPNHIPCDQKAYPVKLITTGMPVNAESPEYIISIPNNLMVTFPTSEAFKTEFIIENQPSYIFRVRNTCTSFFRKTNNTSIQSDSFLGKKTFIIPMHVECKFNTIFRLLANTSVDRNNTIIIIITGLLSAAGFMVTQLVKAYWMEREINEKIKERLASSVQDFKESLIEDPIRALSIYTTTEESEEEEEYLIRCRKIIERRNLIEPFSLIVIDHLKHREWDRAQRILNEIEKSYQNNETFNVLCELTKACQAFTTKNLDMGITLDFYVVFFAYRIFGEKIEEEIKNILLFFCSQQETIIKTQKALEKMEAEYPVIFQAQFVDNIQLIVSSEKFIELTSTEELSHEIKEAIERIKSWPEIYEKYITL
ncbi:MAG: hypothetical protein JXB38_05225, partial [Anaerolineales bacterium]|nr:hypothetical protein [Anaerolineales bacterium]